jgi:hypothetical protein
MACRPAGTAKSTAGSLDLQEAFTSPASFRAPQALEDGRPMNTQPDKPLPQPIIEPWRIAVLMLIFGGAMLFVHAVVPVGA